jgi:hypothetical protein
MSGMAITLIAVGALGAVFLAVVLWDVFVPKACASCGKLR